MGDLSPLGQTALEYVRQGLAVFPLQPRSKLPFEGSRGFKDATTAERYVRRWWTNCPDANIGIALGAMSGGVFAVDVDNNHDNDMQDGSSSLAQYEAEHGKLPPTRTNYTGSGGTHLLYRCPPGVSVRSTGDVLPNVQIKGDGGYIVAPPSTHPNGNMYTVEDWSAEIAVADEAVLTLARMNHAQDRPLFRLPTEIPQGERDDTLMRYGASLRAKGMGDDDIAAALHDANRARCSPPLDGAQVDKIVRSVCRYEQGRKTTVEVEVRNGKAVLQSGDKGPFSNMENARRILEGDSRVAGRLFYDMTAYSKMVVLPLPWRAEDRTGRRDVADWVINEDYSGLAWFAECEYGYKGRDKLEAMLAYVAMRHKVNPLTDMLRGYAERWDGRPRVESLLHDMLGAEDNTWSGTVMRIFMNGAVMRAFKPGVKFDYVPILVGRQGIGKSLFTALLATAPRWLCENFSTVGDDSATEKLRGVWIIELDELLADKGNKGVEAVKAFVTTTVDTIRPKYGKETEQRPRMCVFVGTTNDTQFLHDPTGNRRFLPVECGLCEPTVDMFTDREGALEHMRQAWGEVVSDYLRNYEPLGVDLPLVLPRGLSEMADAVRERYTEDDPLPGLVAKWVEEHVGKLLRADPTGGCADTPEWRVCVSDLVDHLSETAPAVFGRTSEKKLRNAIGQELKKQPQLTFKGKYNTERWGRQKCYVVDNSKVIHRVLKTPFT